jgi:hypothetical protein
MLRPTIRLANPNQFFLPVRKVYAIVIICIFGFSQYARHISYLECKIRNMAKPAANRCDCEKQAGFEKSGEEQSSAPKAHLHNHLDDFFYRPEESDLLPAGLSTIITGHSLPDDELDGNYPNPWRPPDC